MNPIASSCIGALVGISVYALFHLGQVIRLLTEIRDELKRETPAP